MARCEDFPCCGHELGCCPDYDEAGNQLNMKCICGATLPLHNRVSLCDTCLRAGDEDTNWDDRDDDEEEDEDTDDEYADDDLLPGEDMDGDHDSCMRDIGWGTDEDYGFYGDD